MIQKGNGLDSYIISIKNKKERLHALFLHTNHLNLGAYSKLKTHFL